MTAPARKTKSAGSRSDFVYAGLRRAIIEQALMPGDKLTEDVIGDRFGVSRTIVRAALARLHAEGLVDLQPNKGATIAQPSLSEAYDIFEARMCLERQVLARLAEKVTDRDIQRLEQHVAQEMKAGSQDGPAAIRLAGEFHILLAQLAGNGVLARYVDEVVSRCSLILALYGRPHSSDCSINEHQQIIDALRERNSRLAIDAMDHHLRAVTDRALLSSNTDKQRDIRSILDHYAS
ncbi:DNA-binding GntR family transcriptional regulator [Microvirga flocculans]|uniref:DNA-binding GntR family transcriptional regulator n=1 Tax=Microvirga flocculans TaxID=217168 RepID=A0A7W6IF14_9HYPH|nr:GntR family transcriptional regulator [Microvirga flocculans]MBB4040283.1 DNA-binding GntR family transcriptional regulator [Microvirga flocculans]